MRAVLLAIVLGGCASEADLVLELRRATLTSTVSIDVCDAARPEDCNRLLLYEFGPDLVTTIAIYFDSAITPPLSVQLQQNNPTTCRFVDIDPAIADERIIVMFPTSTGGDLVTDPIVVQRQCPF